MKGIKLTWITLRVIKTGSTIVGCMAWETPYVELFDDVSNKKYIWISENAGIAKENLKQNNIVQVCAFAYGDSIRRVTIRIGHTDGYEYFGMNRIAA